jgi:hypothetical protein
MLHQNRQEKDSEPLILGGACSAERFSSIKVKRSAWEMLSKISHATKGCVSRVVPSRCRTCDREAFHCLRIAVLFFKLVIMMRRG